MRCAPSRVWQPGGQVDAGQRIGDRVRRADRHAAEGVDDPAEPAEPDLGVVVESQSGGLLDGLGQQRRTTFGEGRVDLVLAAAGDVT